MQGMASVAEPTSQQSGSLYSGNPKNNEDRLCRHLIGLGGSMYLKLANLIGTLCLNFHLCQRHICMAVAASGWIQENPCLQTHLNKQHKTFLKAGAEQSRKTASSRHVSPDSLLYRSADRRLLPPLLRLMTNTCLGFLRQTSTFRKSSTMWPVYRTSVA